MAVDAIGVSQKIKELHDEAVRTGQWERAEIEGLDVTIAPESDVDEVQRDYWHSYVRDRRLVGPCLHPPADKPDETLIPRLMAVAGILKDKGDHLSKDVLVQAANRIEYLEANLEAREATATTAI